MHRFISVAFAVLVLGSLEVNAGIPFAPSKLHFLCESPYTTLTLFWNDNSGDETGFVIEQLVDGGSWSTVAVAGANAQTQTIASFDRSISSEFRVSAYNAVETSPPSDTVRVVGTNDTLEVYPEVPGIRTPQTHTINGITFSEIQDQCPVDPSQGKVTRVSTFFEIEVRPATGGAWLPSPVYETRPQIRNYLAQNDPWHTGGRRPYVFGDYGPNSDVPGRTLHSKHWTNFDSAEDVIVRLTLLNTAGYPGNINLHDLEIQPTPIAVSQVNSKTIDITLPGAAEDYTLHYRVVVNRTAWNELAGRHKYTREAPLFIFVNPMQPAPASAPEGEFREFDRGRLLVMGPGIHLPDDHWRFFGDGENGIVREFYAPGDAYLHAGFVVHDNDYQMKIYGRAIYSDEMFALREDMADTGYQYSDHSRTPWSGLAPTEGNAWGIKAAFDGKAALASNNVKPTIYEGFTSISGEIGPSVLYGAHAHVMNHKDVGYCGGTYQDGKSRSYYTGNLLMNSDDVTFTTEDSHFDHNTTFVLVNGPSFQFGWAHANRIDSPMTVLNHTVMTSDRNDSGFWHNLGVFNDQLQLGKMEYHMGGYFENFEMYGRENIVWNFRIFDEGDPTENVTSVFGDKTFKNFTIEQHSFSDNLLWGDQNPARNQKSYLRFLHFDNVVIEGNRIDHIDDGDFFTYNEAVLLHTLTFFSLPDPVADPGAGNAPLGSSIQLFALSNSKIIQMDSSLPESLGPICANGNTDASPFTVVDAGNGYVALRASNNYYVKVDPQRYGYLYTEPDLIRGDTNTQTITEEARFRWVDQGSGHFALYSKVMRLYVRVEPNCGPEMPLYAASDSVGLSEIFSNKYDSLTIEDFETGDFSMFDWRFSGEAHWNITSQQTASGSYSAQAGSIEHGEISTLAITLDCSDGDISFYCRSSSESGYDYLQFYIDEVKQGEWSGEQDWIQVFFNVMAGRRTFEWTYSKDSSETRGDDTAWIDDIVFSVN